LSTPNNLIFNKFLKLIDDKTIASSLSDQDMTEILDDYRSEVSAIRFKNCKKNLSNIEIPDFYSEKFIADGTTTTYTISKYPNSPNSSAIKQVCTINGFDITTFAFNEETLTFTINESLQEYDEIFCGYEFVGQYNEDLDDQEQWIIAYGMILSWVSHILFSEKKMKDRLTTKDYNSHSPANLLEKITELKNTAKIELRDLKNDYSFDNFTGFN
jgi:hypothetical protein